MLSSALSSLNRHPLWHRRVRVGLDRLRATSLDRLVYLWYWQAFKSRWAESSFLRSCLQRGMHVVDVGANIGVYSHLFARCVGPDGRVTAFEPDPVLFQALKANSVGNGLAQIQPHSLALGPRSGKARLSRGRFNSGDNRLAAPADTSGPGLEIEVVTLDEFLGGAPVDFIKIDVQGWELHVLQGMGKTLANNPKVRLYLEFWPYGLTRVGSMPGELFRALANQGFKFKILRTGSPSPASLDLKALTRRAVWFANVHAWRP